MIKLIAVLLIATAGGVFALILGEINSGKEIVFTAGGMIIAVFCIRILYLRYRITQKLIDNGKL